MPSWDATKPASASFLISSEVRQNFEAAAYALYGVNLCADPTFLIWPAGDTSAPAHWTTSGSPTIARSGTGLGDTTRKIGKYCLKLTGGASTGFGIQNILTTTTYDDFLDGQTISAGCWVKCSSSSAARIGFDDGVGTTTSTYHTGGGSWEWLPVTRTIDNAATKLQFNVSVAAGVAAHFSGPTVVLGATPPAWYQPAPVVYGVLYFPIPGTVTTGTQKQTFMPSRPGIVKDVMLYAKTAPTGQALIVDVNNWDSSFTSMFATRPQIAAGANAGSAQPDGTYRYRCFTGGFTTTPTNALLSFDVDQVGSGTAGADLSVHIRCMQYARPLEAFLGHNEVN